MRGCGNRAKVARDFFSFLRKEVREADRQSVGTEKKTETVSSGERSADSISLNVTVEGWEPQRCPLRAL